LARSLPQVPPAPENVIILYLAPVFIAAIFCAGLVYVKWHKAYLSVAIGFTVVALFFLYEVFFTGQPNPGGP
jgi:hypothetical protein